MDFQIHSDTKTLTKLIKEIAERSQKNREAIRLAAVGCIEHLILHGNTTPLTSLYRALGPDSRRNQAFIPWAKAFAPVSWKEGKDVNGVKEDGNFVVDKKRMDAAKEGLAADRLAFLRPMVERPYWDFVKEPPVTAFQLYYKLESLIKAAIKRRDEEDPVIGDDFEGLAKLSEILESLPKPTRVRQSRIATADKVGEEAEVTVH